MLHLALGIITSDVNTNHQQLITTAPCVKIDLIDIQRRLNVRAPCHNDTVTNIATRGLEVISKWIHSHGKKAISNYQDQLGVVYSSFVSLEAKKCCPVARLRILISPSLHAVFSFTVIKYTVMF